MGDFFLTSSADAKIVRTAFNPTTTDASNASRKSIDTKHAGQQGLSIRSDGRIFATAGWDARVRVYSAKTLKELAVLKWHKEGCYSTAFADVDSPSDSAVVADNGEHALACRRWERWQNISLEHLLKSQRGFKITLSISRTLICWRSTSSTGSSTGCTFIAALKMAPSDGTIIVESSIWLISSGLLRAM